MWPARCNAQYGCTPAYVASLTSICNAICSRTDPAYLLVKQRLACIVPLSLSIPQRQLQQLHGFIIKDTLATADNMAIGILGLITRLTVVFTLQVYTACPHCKQQSKHLNNTVMAFFTEQGLTPKLNGKEPDLVEVILPPPGPHHILAKLCYSMVVNQNWTCVFS